MDVTFSSFALKVGKGSQAIFDMVKYGWKKANNLTVIGSQFVAEMEHAMHVKKG